MKGKLMFISLVCVALLFSCSKDDDKTTPAPNTNNNNDPTPETPTPEFNQGNGTLVAIKSKTVTETPLGPVPITIGTAVVVFYDNPTSSTFLDGGEVTVEGEVLTQNNNNTYTFIPSATSPAGISYNSTVNWDVEGTSALDGFSYNVNIDFPNIGEITSDTVVLKTQDYVLTANNVSGADSVIFQVGNIIRTVPGNADTYTFTPSDMTNLITGQSIVQIAAYKSEFPTLSTNNKYYFVNEVIASQVVTIK